MYNINPYLQQLLREHSSAKRKMVLGIVFLSVGLVFAWLGGFMALEDPELIVVAAIAWPFWFVGAPFFIIGLVKRLKVNRLINQARVNPAYADPQAPVGQPWVVQPPVQPQPPVAEPVVVEPAVEPVVAEPVAAEPVATVEAEPVAAESEAEAE